VPATTSPTPVLVLDFDGTLCLGDDPVLLYAEEVAALLPDDDAERLLAGLAEFLAGRLRLPDVEDGYHAIWALTADAGLAREQLGRAYYASRERMEAGEGSVHAPDGVVELLDDVRAAGVRTVLVTNAPATGAVGWLDSVGLGARLDAVVPDAGKPGRMAEHLTTMLVEAGAAEHPHLLASVGDVWKNDVEPAERLGARGFHIDRFGADPGPATARAATFGELYPAVRAWAADVGSAV
jgi:FMN phosphatase YigB (HAD superfamily)